MSGGFEETRRSFALRFFRWSEQDWKREVSDRLRVLRSIQGMTAQAVVALLESLSPVQQEAMASALLTRGHRATLEALGRPTTPDQRRLLERRDAVSLIPSLALMHGGADRRRLRELIKNRVSPIIGVRDDASGPRGSLRYVRRFDGFRVQTTIDTGGSTFQMCYDHSILGNGERQYLLRRTSVLSWLGVSAQTNWDALKSGDEPEAVDSLAHACDHFMKAMGGLLEGLPQ